MTQIRPSLRASYSDLFLRLTDAVVLVEPENFLLIDANVAAETLYGKAWEELAGKPVLDFIPESERENFLKMLRVSRRRYHPRSWNSGVLPADQETPIVASVFACTLQLGECEALQVIFRDITAEQENEQRIKDYVTQLEVLNKRLHSLSTTDEMTQLANFRHFQDQLRQEHARAHRYKTAYAVVFLDVDHFKKYNDRNGHPAGDEVLKGVAEHVAASCRETDIPARYGGEEFVVLCPAVNAAGAWHLAERIRKRILAKAFPFGEHQPLGAVTVSVGVASFPEHGETAEEILAAADQALYQSKHLGRNRTTCRSEVST